MKETIKQIARRLGLEIRGAKRSPYEYLRKIPRYQETSVDLEGYPFKVADARSFLSSHREIFLDEIYKFDCKKDNPVILDCGSNYGASVVYFKTIYPKSKIKAVEADPRIFELLEWNLKNRGLDDVELINKAVSDLTDPIRFFANGADGGRIFPHEDSSEVFTVEPIRLDDLIDSHIDFLKVDIEGAETEVIVSSNKLEQVDRIFIEYHSFVDTEQQLDIILRKLTEANFRYYIHQQFSSLMPFMETKSQHGMDVQLNLFAIRSK